jgi:hypothetical protein
MKRDLLAAFSSIDHETSADLNDDSLDREFQRLLIRLCALSSLHGSDVPAQLIRALQHNESADPFALVSHILDTGMLSGSEYSTGRRELQQELVHFSRIVDIGTTGFDLPPAPSAKRVRNSHRLPESLKVLSELMLVARGRLIQHGREIVPSTNRRPGSHRQEPWADVLVQAPTHTNDHVLIVVSPRRRLRLQFAYYLETLLCYLPPADAFTTTKCLRRRTSANC